jgi:hypothetical protein
MKARYAVFKRLQGIDKGFEGVRLVLSRQSPADLSNSCRQGFLMGRAETEWAGNHDNDTPCVGDTLPGTFLISGHGVWPQAPLPHLEVRVLPPVLQGCKNSFSVYILQPWAATSQSDVRAAIHRFQSAGHE